MSRGFPVAPRGDVAPSSLGPPEPELGEEAKAFLEGLTSKGPQKRIIQVVVERLGAIGVDVDSVLEGASLTETDISDPAIEITPSSQYFIWYRAHEVDPDFGLHLAEAIGPGTFDLIDYLARSSANLGQSVELAARYFHLMGLPARLSLERGEEVSRVGFSQPRPGLIPERGGEAFLASVLTMLRQMSGQTIDPVEVHTVSRRPADTREYERIFKAPVVFEAEQCVMVLPAALLDLPVVSADPNLRTLLARYAQDLLGRLPIGPSISDRARRAIARDISNGTASLERVAHRLAMSTRTLRRRLQEEGTTHQRLVDEVRCDVARRFLEERRSSVEEAALQLGFSDSSGLRRLLKRTAGS